MAPKPDGPQPDTELVGFRAPVPEKTAVKILAEHRQSTLSDLLREKGWDDLVTEAREFIERLEKARSV